MIASFFNFFMMPTADLYNKLDTLRTWADINVLPMFYPHASGDFPAFTLKIDESIFRNSPFKKER